jgi:hypothetical protein
VLPPISEAAGRIGYPVVVKLDLRRSVGPGRRRWEVSALGRETRYPLNCGVRDPGCLFHTELIVERNVPRCHKPVKTHDAIEVAPWEREAARRSHGEEIVAVHSRLVKIVRSICRYPAS